MDNEFSSGCDTLESMSQHGSSGPRSYSLKYLEKITNGFSEKIGEGGFGMVYKGWLPNGETVAVKKVNSSMLPGVTDKQFDNEANHLKRLKHPNIVLLVGWCSETEHIYVELNGKHICAEKTERLLCLEYMPNGNLRQHLKDESSRLTWETRYKIIEGICYGLRYLHEESQLSPIVHMDLKPSNILLDNNMMPKIADFGLSRLFSEEKTKTSTINCNGTLGYMSPEYINKGIISRKLDIFSLGVVIIEIVTGHRDYLDGNGGISSAQDFIKLVLKDWRNRLQKSQEIDYQQIRRCIQIGLACVKCDWSKRPTISQVIKMLTFKKKVIKMLQETESAVQSHPTLTDDKQILSHGFEVVRKDMPLELLRQSTDSFSEEQKLGSGTSGTMYKDGHEIRVGDCCLFRAVDGPPFIGLIRWIEKKEEGYPKLRVSWLYRPADIKLNKGLQLNAARNEIFFSFHQDETSADSLLHPCKVAFLHKGVELPSGVLSFVCWRVYDIDNKCLWWLTDQDFIHERQEEVNGLLYRTRLEMHATVQSGGRSPKSLNGPSASQQLKTASDGTQNGSLSKGKKRERSEQGVDPAKRVRDRLLKVEDSEPGSFNLDDIKSEIAKITEKGGLPNAEAVEKLVHLMQKIDLSGRVLLADVIAATESPDCLGRFVQSRGLPVLDSWLQEAHKLKSGDGSSPKEADKPIDKLLLALLRALAKLPINLSALQSCRIGKSVNDLRSHKNLEIQKKAKCLVENWKKRVEVELKSTDVKHLVSVQYVSWPGKAGFQDISNAGTKWCGSSENSPKNPVPTLSSSMISLEAQTLQRR